MKKNFLKRSFASTLAVAMVATSMPAAFTTSKAAALPTFNKTAKYLYINENEVGNEFDLNINNKLKGWKYQWSTSNKNIATVGGYGMVRPASQTGVAYISCKITFKNKNTKTLKAKITVKENANKVWGTNVPTEAIGVGAKAHDFNSAFSTASGAKATDYRVWEIAKEGNTAGATFEGEAKYGIVNTANPGEFKIRVRAYQSRAKLAANDTVDSEWYTIKVAPSLQSVKQSTTSKVDVTFDADMKELVKREDFSIKNKATNVVTPVKDITFSEDGKVVSVEAFGKFTDGSTYVLTYGGKDVDFNATIGAVDKIVVDDVKVFEQEEASITYKLFNAAGVDITSEFPASSVTISEVDNKNGYFDSSSNKLTIYKAGDQATLKFVYHTGNYDNTGVEVGTKETVATFTAQVKTAATIGSYKNYVVSKDAPNWDSVKENKNVICIGESDMNLYLNALDSNKNTVDGLTFKSGNENVLLVGTNTDGKSASILGVQEGSTVVNVYRGETYLWSLPVVVKAQRKAASVSLATNSITVSNTFDNNNEIKVSVKDQYQEDFAGSTATLTEITALNQAAKDLSDADLAKLVTIADSNVVVNGNGIAAGTYQVSVKLIGSNVQAVLTIKVVANTGTTTNSIGFLNATTKVDATVNSDTVFTDNALTVTNKLYELDNAGIASGAASTAVVTGKTPKGEDAKEFFTFKDGELKFNYATKDASTKVVTAAPAGTYRFDASVTVGTTVKRTVLYITVENNQTKPSIKIKDNVVVTSSDESTIASKITVNKDNCTVINPTGDQIVQNGSKVYVKEVTVHETISEEVIIAHTIKVEQTFTIQ